MSNSKDHFTARIQIKEVLFEDAPPARNTMGSVQAKSTERAVMDVLDVTVRADTLEQLKVKVETVMGAA